MIRAPILESSAVRHAFFTREGGVSGGLFASLNCSASSGDDVAHVAENRRRAASELGVALERLVLCQQVHGTDVVKVAAPWTHETRPHADGMVTKEKGVAIGILTADCAPVLLVDAERGIVGACHAGWRGALGGILAATVEVMIEAGAARERIAAAVGPSIGFPSYEVGAEFPAPFLAQTPGNAAFFSAGARPAHFQFDLPAYVASRLRAAGIATIAATGGDTAAEGARFFSYRRACLAGERQFGHQLSAICLAP